MNRRIKCSVLNKDKTKKRINYLSHQIMDITGQPTINIYHEENTNYNL